MTPTSPSELRRYIRHAELYGPEEANRPRDPKIPSGRQLELVA
jgi:hypothetical protein